MSLQNVSMYSTSLPLSHSSCARSLNLHSSRGISFRRALLEPVQEPRAAAAPSIAGERCHVAGIV